MSEYTIVGAILTYWHIGILAYWHIGPCQKVEQDATGTEGEGGQIDRQTYTHGRTLQLIDCQKQNKIKVNKQSSVIKILKIPF